MAPDSSKPNGTVPDVTVTVARNFLIGVSLSGVPMLAYLWLSVDMTYGSWAAVETWQWTVAILIPLLCGMLSAVLGRKIIGILSALVEGVQLPF